MEQNETQTEKIEIENDLVKEDVKLSFEPDWKDSYLRLLADFDNYKKRMVREKEEIRTKTKLDTLSSILELDNDIHFSLKMIGDKKSLEVVKIFTDKLQSFLKSKGIEEIQTTTYDADIHEVVSVVETGTETILDVVSKGYKMNGQIVKHPKIILSK